MAKRIIKSAEPFPFEKIGDSIAGVFQKIKEIQFEDKDEATKGAIIVTAEGDTRIVWLSSMLVDAFEEIQPGEFVTITMTGNKPSKVKGRSATKLYTVEIGQ